MDLFFLSIHLNFRLFSFQQKPKKKVSVPQVPFMDQSKTTSHKHRRSFLVSVREDQGETPPPLIMAPKSASYLTVWWPPTALTLAAPTLAPSCGAGTCCLGVGCSSAHTGQMSNSPVLGPSKPTQGQGQRHCTTALTLLRSSKYI
jgi:hypothetical protein